MWSVGVDLGATKTEVAHVNSNGIVESRIRFNTDAHRDPQEIQNDIINAVKELKSKSDIKPEGVGIGVAGQVEKNTGLVCFAPNLNWHNVPLQENLFNALNIPVSVTNDVRAAAMGEWLHGSGRGYQDFICIFIGTGIGSGIVSEGRLITGWNNAAGEVGHMTVELNGPKCTCGNHGCIETFAAGWGLAKRAEDALKDLMITSSLRPIYAKGPLSAKDVINAAKENDPIALAVLKNGADALVAGVANLLNIFNPQLIVLGGGLYQNWPKILDTISEGIKSHALRVATQEVKVVPAIQGGDAGLIGAASLFF